MRNIKLTIQYDGSAYIGWQRQAARHGLSVQQAVEEAIGEVMGAPTVIHGAGRTDRGVHARAQVASFLCPVNIPTEKIALALNHLLPPDIRVMLAEDVPDDFHARFFATGKRYRYLLAADAPTAFNYRWYWPLDKLPDAAAMQEAAAYLIGEHDFRHFTLANATVSNFVRQLREVRVYQPMPEELPCRLEAALAIEAEASGFLYKMMRLITSRLVAVGQGRLEPQAMQKFLQGERPLRLPPAPPQGLMLMKVYYAE